MSFEWLAEQQIQTAKSQGKLDNLKGQGKPLPARISYEKANPTEATGYRIMADNGVLPREVQLNAAVREAHRAYHSASTDDGKRAAMHLLSELQLRQAMEKDARLRIAKHWR